MLTPQLPPPDSKPEAQFSDDLVEKVGELKALRAWMATAKKAADQLRDEILQELGDADKVQRVVNGCLEQGVLGFWFLSCPTAFRIAPPLVISEEEVRLGCEAIKQELERL